MSCRAVASLVFVVAMAAAAAGAELAPASAPMPAMTAATPRPAFADPIDDPEPAVFDDLVFPALMDPDAEWSLVVPTETPAADVAGTRRESVSEAVYLASAPAPTPEAEVAASATPFAPATPLVATALASESASASPVRVREAALRVPAGFKHVAKPRPASADGRFILTDTWLKLVDSHVHALLLGYTRSDRFAELGEDPGAYVPMILRGLQGPSTRFTVTQRHAETICGGQMGYVIKYQDRGPVPIAATVVFAVFNDTVYTAIYQHDLESPDLRDAERALDTLCPPESNAT